MKSLHENLLAKSMELIHNSNIHRIKTIEIPPEKFGQHQKIFEDDQKPIIRKSKK